MTKGRGDPSPTMSGWWRTFTTRRWLGRQAVKGRGGSRSPGTGSEHAAAWWRGQGAPARHLAEREHGVRRAGSAPGYP